MLALALGAAGTHGLAARELPLEGPIPADRPAPTPRIDTQLTTSTIPAATRQARLAIGGDLRVLTAGLNALAGGDIASARRHRDQLGPDTLDRRILAWAIALGGGGSVPSHEIAETASRLANWPGQLTMRENSERALYRERPEPRAVIAAFGSTEPRTAQGAIALTRALLATGNEKAASTAISRFWRETKLEAQEEAAILKEFGRLIPREAHRHRMEYMLHEDRITSAGRVARLAGAEALHAAWAAVIRNQGDAGKLLGAVPKAQRGSGYLFALARHQRRAGKFADAARTMAAVKGSVVQPDRWWTERRVLSRELLDIGEARLAYQVAANHAATGAEAVVDAEFHAGWYALRSLKDARTAMQHFRRIAEISSGPISQARAWYWMGRAAEAGASGQARPLYEHAARFGTTFYGQLAAARLGHDRLNADYPRPTPEDRARFEKRELVAAIRRLEEAGYGSRANILYLSLARELTSPGELAMLAVMAENRGNHDLALRVGKAAAARGIDIGSLAHPVGVIPASAGIPDERRALAYAVARQESEFNQAAVSSAGARGLLQLMPNTAREMARKAGLAFSAQKLTSDPAYNANLGTAYLAEQMQRFNGSYILTFAAYNAGPTRANEWASRYGDPRGKPLDFVIDWIERIPFTETRSYVQRVMENYQVYQMRLTGRFSIESDLRRGG